MDINKWYNKRICFHEDFGKEAYPFKLPVFDTESKKLLNEIEEQIFTQEDFLSWLYENNDLYRPQMPSFEFLRTLLKSKNPEICLTAFIEQGLGELIDLESACHAYRTLPFEGGLLDQPQLFLDAFETIRSERNRYENFKNQALFDKMKSKTDSTPAPTKSRKR